MPSPGARPAPPPTDALDWSQLGFKDRKVNGQVVVTWRDGKWGEPEWSTDPYLKIHAAATCLNYGQQAFEGIKAFRTSKSTVHIFRPQENAARINLSARMASMPEVPEALFLDCLKKVVAGNLEFVPPYAKNASGGALYIRPLLIATGPNLILDPPNEFTLVTWVTPVGSLYGAGKDIPAVDAFILDTFDRTAPMGTGCSKLGGNYAPVFGPTAAAKKRGYPITLHLDSAQRKYIDEFSTSNALAISTSGGADSKDSEGVASAAGAKPTLVVPESTTILRSVTKLSIIDIAEKLCGWKVDVRPVTFDELKAGGFQEFMAAGTAAGITPVRTVSYNSHSPKLVSGGSTSERNGPQYEHPAENEVLKISFGDGQTAGPAARELFDKLTSYQCGDLGEDKFGWLWPAEGIVPEDAI